MGYWISEVFCRKYLRIALASWPSLGSCSGITTELALHPFGLSGITAEPALEWSPLALPAAPPVLLSKALAKAAAAHVLAWRLIAGI